MILDHPNCFRQLQIVLVRSKLFWSGSNHFGQVQIRLLWTDFYHLDPTKLIWTQPKRIGPDQNKLNLTKRFFLFSKFDFCAGTKVFEEALNGIKFLEWHKKICDL